MQQAQALVAQLALEAEALARLRAAVTQRDVGALEGALQQASSLQMSGGLPELTLTLTLTLTTHLSPLTSHLSPSP